MQTSNTFSRRARLRASLIIAFALATLGALLTAAPAQAWPWSSTVKVWGTVSQCGPTAGNGWMWYRTSEGESGWGNIYNGAGSFTFQLNRVPSSGSVVTLKWGVGNCQAVRYFVVSRPTYGDSAAVGWLG